MPEEPEPWREIVTDLDTQIVPGALAARAAALRPS